MTVTATRLGLSFNVNTAVVAVPEVLVLTKFTVPLTVVPVGALAGKPAKLVLISAGRLPTGVTTVTVLTGTGSGVV
ncbi:MAG: hypothetical protein V4454_17670, partial [Pseudomonadota bacterium]